MCGHRRSGTLDRRLAKGDASSSSSSSSSLWRLHTATTLVNTATGRRLRPYAPRKAQTASAIGSGPTEYLAVPGSAFQGLQTRRVGAKCVASSSRAFALATSRDAETVASTVQARYGRKDHERVSARRPGTPDRTASEGPPCPDCVRLLKRKPPKKAPTACCVRFHTRVLV